MFFPVDSMSDLSTLNRGYQIRSFFVSINAKIKVRCYYKAIFQGLQKVQCVSMFHTKHYLSFVKRGKFVQEGVEHDFFLRKVQKLCCLQRIICTLQAIVSYFVGSARPLYGSSFSFDSRLIDALVVADSLDTQVFS